jgi:hypothetical protein
MWAVACVVAISASDGCEAATWPTGLSDDGDDRSVSPASQTVSIDLRGAVFATQQDSAWCWAASIANLFAYYGYPVSQARIVSEVYGAPLNMRSGDYSNLARLLHRSWRDDRGRPFTSSLLAALDVPNGIDTMTNDHIRDALNANTPLVVGTTQHAMLVVGMHYTESNGRVSQVHAVRVFDPWPETGYRNLSAAEMTPATRGGTLLFIALARISR